MKICLNCNLTRLTSVPHEGGALSACVILFISQHFKIHGRCEACFAPTITNKFVDLYAYQTKSFNFFKLKYKNIGFYLALIGDNLWLM